jgi:hypothetical protein
MTRRYVIGLGIVMSALGLGYAFAGVDVSRMLAPVRGLRAAPFWMSQLLTASASPRWRSWA